MNANYLRIYHIIVINIKYKNTLHKLNYEIFKINIPTYNIPKAHLHIKTFL